ncbi:hypothetical protein KC343_g15834 [Hortaea werneckii]|uniref:Aminoglycoside phosphotransferase domain-containing protein n=1 Tax=Hortaea werneckii TaxID=91943 RepID=A0A3M7BVS6_HORWE|nr:hypothetical protein KC352_g23333 [Hortaea werneckii]KAI7560437.1 hypothetical protein KC317_g9731 [Hortaea werneckii]KAI7598896.1 hypothetical protein KC346_g14007 [Hortaea werneckii]KAI7599963.1 hypothetical protein KC343_g15834 [Hortaea werneckii]KAI7640742.1 hypothetical protein KC319_g13840 [Hortaea werneckii]
MTASTETPDRIVEVANTLLRPKDLQLKKYTILQRLWAGYGHICHIEAAPINNGKIHSKTSSSFILKLVSPPTTTSSSSQTSSSTEDEGHLRKLISYQVERYFYTHLAAALPADVAVAACVGSIHHQPSAGDDGEQDGEQPTIALMLEDLREGFPVAGEKRTALEEWHVFAALDWLAKFHGFWWARRADVRKDRLRLAPLEEARLAGSRRTEGVWLNGGYTYLATRRKEYADLLADADSEWSSALCRPVPSVIASLAELVAQVLSPDASSDVTPSDISAYETLIHGDVKSENLFANTEGSAVAFFDFQYVGIGLGVCDLAKLFTCSVPMHMLTTETLSGDMALAMTAGERGLLQRYQRTISSISGKEYPWRELEMHWSTALVDWLRFQASWGFWGNTEWLEARVRHILGDQQWLEWVVENSQASKR